MVETEGADVTLTLVASPAFRIDVRRPPEPAFHCLGAARIWLNETTTGGAVRYNSTGGNSSSRRRLWDEHDSGSPMSDFWDNDDAVARRQRRRAWAAGLGLPASNTPNRWFIVVNGSSSFIANDRGIRRRATRRRALSKSTQSSVGSSSGLPRERVGRSWRQLTVNDDGSTDDFSYSYENDDDIASALRNSDADASSDDELLGPDVLLSGVLSSTTNDEEELRLFGATRADLPMVVVRVRRFETVARGVAAQLAYEPPGVYVTALDPANPLDIAGHDVHIGGIANESIGQLRLDEASIEMLSASRDYAIAASVDMLYDVAVSNFGGLLDGETTRIRYAPAEPFVYAPWILTLVSATLLKPTHARLGVRLAPGLCPARPVPARAIIPCQGHETRAGIPGSECVSGARVEGEAWEVGDVHDAAAGAHVMVGGWWDLSNLIVEFMGVMDEVCVSRNV